MSGGFIANNSAIVKVTSQRVPVHIVYPSRRNVATRTRVVMDYVVVELTREISALLAQGAEVLT